MVETTTPVCDFGKAAIDFNLPDYNGKNWSLADCRGDKATLIFFICNHCPFVKAIIACLCQQIKALESSSIKAVAIMSNDYTAFPADSVENMQLFAEQHQFSFPYLVDTSQEIAKAYGAVCTPDFFAYNSDMKLQYRGRFNSAGRQPSTPDMTQDLYNALQQIATTGKGPTEQKLSIGCSIKWR